MHPGHCWRLQIADHHVHTSRRIQATRLTTIEMSSASTLELWARCGLRPRKRGEKEPIPPTLRVYEGVTTAKTLKRQICAHLGAPLDSPVDVHIDYLTSDTGDKTSNTAGGTPAPDNEVGNANGNVSDGNASPPVATSEETDLICLDDVLEFICAKENQKENLQRFIAAPIFGKLLSPLVLAFDVSWPQTIQVAATPVAGIPGAPATISKSGKSRELIHAHVNKLVLRKLAEGARKYLPRDKAKGIWLLVGDPQQWDVLVQLTVGYAVAALYEVYPDGMPKGTVAPSVEEIRSKLVKQLSTHNSDIARKPDNFKEGWWQSWREHCGVWETDIKDLYDNRGIEPTLPDDLSKLLTLATDGYKASKCKKDKKDKKEKDKKDNTKDKSEDDVLVQQQRVAAEELAAAAKDAEQSADQNRPGDWEAEIAAELDAVMAEAGNTAGVRAADTHQRKRRTRSSKGKENNQEASRHNKRAKQHKSRK